MNYRLDVKKKNTIVKRLKCNTLSIFCCLQWKYFLYAHTTLFEWEKKVALRNDYFIEYHFVRHNVYKLESMCWDSQATQLFFKMPHILLHFILHIFIFIPDGSRMIVHILFVFQILSQSLYVNFNQSSRFLMTNIISYRIVSHWKRLSFEMTSQNRFWFPLSTWTIQMN